MSSFQPGRGPTVLTLCAVAAFCALGFWQISRLHWRERDLAEKAARTLLEPVPLAEASRDPRASAFRRVIARGRFELADSMIVPAERGQELGGRVLTPLREEGAADDTPRVLVDRGWIPEASFQQFLPPDPGSPQALGEPVEVHGLALELATRDAQPGPRTDRKTYQARFNPDRPGVIAKIAAQIPYPLAPVMVQSAEPEPGGLPIGEAAKPASPVDHRAYAITWFAVAALCLAAYVEYGFRRAREQAEAASRARARSAAQ
ncbi:MAG TPA: SURF1 family protein [Myxococcota bacterium]|nr:SURF1 family protein [Myxococcota bacterium]